MPNTNYNEIWNILKTIVELIFINIPIRLTIVKNIARIAKAALHKLPGKSSLNVWSVFPGCPGFPVYTDDYDDEDPDDHDGHD